jgi:hypothetical protein
MHIMVNFLSKIWFGTFIYASNDGLIRRKLWKDLDNIKATMGADPLMIGSL